MPLEDKQSGNQGSGPGKDPPGKSSGPSPGKISLVEQLGSGSSPSGASGSGSSSAPMPTAAAAVSTLAPLNITGEVASFGSGGGVAHDLVGALAHVTTDQDVAKHTIAMFQYMDTHGAALTAKIAADFDVLGEPEKKNHYLIELGAAMSPKLGGKGLWTGEEQRGMIAMGIAPLGPFFHAGKVALLAKATQANAQHRPLAGLLTNHSMNMEAKSYGRRAESMENIDIGSLPMPPAPRPKAGDRVACNDPRCKYLEDDYVTKVEGHALKPGNDYILYFNGSENLSVTVQTNDGTHIVFSAVVD